MITVNLVYVLAFLAFLAIPNAISGGLFLLATVFYLVFPIHTSWTSRTKK